MAACSHCKSHTSTSRGSMRWRLAAFLLPAALAFLAMPPPPALAQADGGWTTDLDVKRPPVAVPAAPRPPDAEAGGGTTVVKKKTQDPTVPGDMSKVRLIALLMADGRRIDQDLVWRVFEESNEPGTAGKLLRTFDVPSPVVTLKPGTYTINAAFGRANLTRKITVAAGVETTEPFILNAGGLRVRINQKAGMEGMKAYFDIMTDERNQSDERGLVLSRVRPDTVIRLNSGIYHVVSTLGDANATVEADVTVEAGKLTEATISHKAGRVTLKLVTRQGGEALPDTEWSVLTSDGRAVKSSVGALPTHVLAPGTYMAIAKSQGNVFRREFAVADGDAIEVEVIRQ